MSADGHADANIFKNAGLEVRAYKYLDAAGVGFDLEGMLSDLKAAPDGSAVLLHACAHNPTGVDPTPEQWKAICATLKARPGLSIFFDSGACALDSSRTLHHPTPHGTTPHHRRFEAVAHAVLM